METWWDGEADRSRKGTARNPQVKRAGLLWGPGEGGRGVGAGRGACPDGPSPSCPECTAGACTGPQEARGRGGAGKRGGVSSPLT